ncbi:MAG: TrmH family RNA methyltransferase [Patescibacteria group bacterium]
MKPVRGPRELPVTRENAAYQHLTALRDNRVKRKQSREILVEGVAAVESLLESGWRVKTAARAMDRPLSAWAEEALRRARPERVYLLSPSLMAALSEKEETSELILTAEMRAPGCRDLVWGPGPPLFVVCDRPANPGNLGSIIRSCSAFAADGLLVSGHAVDIYDPRTIRASLGAIFGLTPVQLASNQEFEAWLSDLRSRAPALQVVGTSARAELALAEVDFTRPTVIAIGNETDGLSGFYRRIADRCARIPMAPGVVSSLNAACAATVVLYEAVRQRGSC